MDVDREVLTQKQRTALVIATALKAAQETEQAWRAQEDERLRQRALQLMRSAGTTLEDRFGNLIFDAFVGPMSADPKCNTVRVAIDLGVPAWPYKNFTMVFFGGPGASLRLSCPCERVGCVQERYSESFYDNGDTAWAYLGRLIRGIADGSLDGFAPHVHTDGDGDPMDVNIAPPIPSIGERLEVLIREIVDDAVGVPPSQVLSAFPYEH